MAQDPTTAAVNPSATTDNTSSVAGPNAQIDQKSNMQDASVVCEGLLGLIKNVKVSDLKISPKIITLDSKTDPKKAIEILLQNNVRAAPVVDNDNNGKFIGVLDLRDTVKFALETYKKQSVSLTNITKKAMEYLTSSPHISTSTLKYLAAMRQFRVVRNTDNLMELCVILAAGAHIVGVSDSNNDNKLIGIITQGSLFQQISAIWMNNNIFIRNGNCLLKILFNLKYITSPVKTIKYNVKAYDAFELMSKLDLSGLAVINNDGILIHNTSATDIKLWLIASSTLEDTIEQFLINIRKLSLIEKYPITVCTLNDTFKRAIQKLAATKYHRLWIVDNDTKPIGVLALTDVFKFLCKTKPLN